MKCPVPLMAMALGIASMTATSRGQQVVRLESWEGRAVGTAHRGPGEQLYRLDAVASWSADASREPGRYLTELVLPDGRVLRRDFLRNQGPPSRRITFFVPQGVTRDLPPSRLAVQAAVLDRRTGQRVSNVLAAGIDQFPHPGAIQPDTEVGPFDFGRPLEGPPGAARRLARLGPDGYAFVRIPASDEGPGFYIATTEATNAQVRDRLPDYDPRATRAGDIVLSAGDHPATGLTPARAQQYLANLSSADGTGVEYRLPTRSEWLRAARAGGPGEFWWGDEPTHPEGANFLGPEPAEPTDSTAPAYPRRYQGEEHFAPNPWGLFHTFGNVAEWATTPEGGFVRMGGHFRTEPASPLPEVAVDGGDQLGPDPYVGLRPAFSLEADQAAELIARALQRDPTLSGVTVSFDPDSGVATLGGSAPDPEARRLASRAASDVWFVGAVADRITTPGVGEGLVVELGEPLGEPRRITPLGRVYDVYTLSARWAGRLPVSGSRLYVNVYMPGGTSYAHALVERKPGGPTVQVLIDRSRIPAGGLDELLDINVGISLGIPAPLPTDTNLISNLAPMTIEVR